MTSNFSNEFILFPLEKLITSNFSNGHKRKLGYINVRILQWDAPIGH